MDALTAIGRLGSGHFMDDLATALTEVAERVVLTGTKGTVTVSFAVEQIKGEPAVMVGEQIKTGLPVPESRGAIYYAIGDGTLSRTDPRQIAMEFRIVEPSESTLRTAPDEVPVREAEL